MRCPCRPAGPDASTSGSAAVLLRAAAEATDFEISPIRRRADMARAYRSHESGETTARSTDEHTWCARA